MPTLSISVLISVSEWRQYNKLKRLVLAVNSDDKGSVRLKLEADSSSSIVTTE